MTVPTIIVLFSVHNAAFDILILMREDIYMNMNFSYKKNHKTFPSKRSLKESPSINR